MIKITPYRSTNYDTPEHAQQVANNLSSIDGNKYIVYCEYINGVSTFHFDNTNEVKVKYPNYVSTNPKQASTNKEKDSSGIQTVSELIEFISSNRKPILDFVQPSERLSTMAIRPSS